MRRISIFSVFAGILTIISPLLLGPSCEDQNSWSGKVIGVADGDTITVLHHNKPTRVRLQGVDCPEKNQPFGTRAKQFTSDLVFGKTVTVKIVNHQDRYGRTVAWVMVDHLSLNEELLQSGFAWHYYQYDKSQKLRQIEQTARNEKKGLWVDQHPIPPWEWRHGLGEKERQKKNLQAKVSLPLPQKEQGPGTWSGPFQGNSHSKIFHRPGCKGYNCKHCTVVFQTIQEALQAGYQPCGRCQPDRKVSTNQAKRTPQNN